jgi:hypothetical protein
MTLTDNCTKYCYIYLLKSKDETLHYFKIYKPEVENQLDTKIKHLGLIEEANTSQMPLTYSVRNTVLSMRGHRLIHPNSMGLPKERKKEPHND